MMIETYRHSGRIGPLEIPLMLIGGLASAIILGTIYAMVTSHQLANSPKPLRVQEPIED